MAFSLSSAFMRGRRTLHATSSGVRRLSLLVKNSLSQAFEPFAAGRSDPAITSFYTCGPTTYADAHIGHARTYVALDIVKRLISSSLPPHMTLVSLMNITDVDDKIIKAGEESGVEPLALARVFERRFMTDMAALNVQPPTAVCRVSEHIPEILAYVQRIIDNGNAYAVPGDGVYFDIRAFGEGRYGKLRPPQQASPAARSDLEGSSSKRDPRDFALWKVSPEAKATTLDWDSPWGRGRPGWHVECSAMIGAYFTGAEGKCAIDFHAGGIDLAFPHHCNEIAQAEAHASPACCNGHHDDNEPWVRYWLHTGHVHIDGRKMSKSLKNFITVRAMLVRVLQVLHDEGSKHNVVGGSSQDKLAVQATDGFQPLLFAHALDDKDRDSVLLRAASPSSLLLAADAFRWFVASHHYRAAITYSEGKLVNGVQRVLQRRKLFHDAFALVKDLQARGRAGGDAQSSMQTQGLLLPRLKEESALVQAINTAFGSTTAETNQQHPHRGNVWQSLNNDFDTPGALKDAQHVEDCLRALVDEAARDTRPLHSTTPILLHALELLGDFYGRRLGLSFGHDVSRWVQQCKDGYSASPSSTEKRNPFSKEEEDVVATAAVTSNAAQEGLAAPPNELDHRFLQSVSDGRDLLRQSGKQLIGLSKKGEAGEAMSAELLRVGKTLLGGADQLRSGFFQPLGWELKDGEVGKPSTLHKAAGGK